MSRCLQRLALAITLVCSTAVQAHDKPVPATTATEVTVGGAVQQSLSLNTEALREFPADQIVTLQLPGKIAGAPPSTLKGVRLRAVLERAKVVTTDHNTVKKLIVVVTATDGYKVLFSWSELFNSELGASVLVLFERDGKPLAAAEGPLALISGKDTRLGPRHVKWLQSVDVRQIVD